MKITIAVTSVIFSALMSSAFASESASGSDKQVAFESGLPSIGSLIDKVLPLIPISGGGGGALPLIPILGGGRTPPIPIGAGGVLPIIPDFPLPIPGKP
jgi:hypothetical protein